MISSSFIASSVLLVEKNIGGVTEHSSPSKHLLNSLLSYGKIAKGYEPEVKASAVNFHSLHSSLNLIIVKLQT